MTDTQANTPAGATVSFSEINEALQRGAEQNPVHARSLMATVVAIAANERLPETHEALQHLASQCAIRAIVISHGTVPAPPATVSGQIVALTGLKPQFVDNAVAALRLSNLPTLVWYRGGTEELLRDLADLADRMVLDESDPFASWKQAQHLIDRTAFSDLRWARLTRWRTLMASFLRHPPRPRHCTVLHASAHQRIGWRGSEALCRLVDLVAVTTPRGRARHRARKGTDRAGAPRRRRALVDASAGQEQALRAHGDGHRRRAHELADCVPGRPASASDDGRRTADPGQGCSLRTSDGCSRCRSLTAVNLQDLSGFRSRLAADPYTRAGDYGFLPLNRWISPCIAPSSAPRAATRQGQRPSRAARKARGGARLRWSHVTPTSYGEVSPVARLECWRAEAEGPTRTRRRARAKVQRGHDSETILLRAWGFRDPRG